MKSRDGEAGEVLVRLVDHWSAFRDQLGLPEVAVVEYMDADAWRAATPTCPPPCNAPNKTFHITVSPTRREKGKRERERAGGGVVLTPE